MLQIVLQYTLPKLKQEVDEFEDFLLKYHLHIKTIIIFTLIKK